MQVQTIIAACFIALWAVLMLKLLPRARAAQKARPSKASKPKSASTRRQLFRPHYLAL